jgi:hypothetical protein
MCRERARHHPTLSSHHNGIISSIFLVNVDDIGSNQMHQIRVALRGKGVVLMGKNTMVPLVCRALRTILADSPQFECLLPYVKGPARAVGSSEATLLNMLNISPFTYGMTVVQIFDQGNVFTPQVLDIDESELIDRFLFGIKTVAAISLALDYPTIVSVTHSLVNAYNNLIVISLLLLSTHLRVLRR